MPTVRIFEPALCCNTGVCGEELDQKLVNFTADLNSVKGNGADIARFNLASDPGAFVADPLVVNFLQAAGSEGLPLTMVDGATVLTGRYPTRQELLRFAGVSEARPVTVLPQASSGCCGGTAATGCC